MGRRLPVVATVREGGRVTQFHTADAVDKLTQPATVAAHAQVEESVPRLAKLVIGRLERAAGRRTFMGIGSAIGKMRKGFKADDHKVLKSVRALHESHGFHKQLTECGEEAWLASFDAMLSRFDIKAIDAPPTTETEAPSAHTPPAARAAAADTGTVGRRRRKRGKKKKKDDEAMEVVLEASVTLAAPPATAARAEAALALPTGAASGGGAQPFLVQGVPLFRTQPAGDDEPFAVGDEVTILAGCDNLAEYVGKPGTLLAWSRNGLWDVRIRVTATCLTIDEMVQPRFLARLVAAQL